MFIYEPTLLKFYGDVAEKFALRDDDKELIFSLSPRPAIELGFEPTSISFWLDGKYQAAFSHKLKANAMSLSADNQRNKTTSLLCIATLLGYAWSNQKNIEFLEEEEFIEKGLALRKAIIEAGRATRLEISRGDRYLCVTAEKGYLAVEYKVENTSNSAKFQLPREVSAFETYMRELIDVQLVAKGRKFIQQIEADALNETIVLARALLENTDQAITRSAARGTRSRQEGLTPMVEIGVYEKQIRDHETAINQKEEERKPITGQQAILRQIIRHLSELSPEAASKIQQVYRFHSRISSIDRALQERNEEQKTIEDTGRTVASLENEYNLLNTSLNDIKNAFDFLSESIIHLIETKQIKAAPDVESLQESIEQANIKGIHELNDKRLSIASIEVYQSLIAALEVFSDPVYILPLSLDLENSHLLKQKLLTDLETVKNRVALNTVITEFLNQVTNLGISTSRTPIDHQLELVRLNKLNQELQQSKANLQVLQDTQSSPIVGQEKVESLRQQIADLEANLSESEKIARQEVEDMVEALKISELSTPIVLSLNDIWSATGIEYVQDVLSKLVVINRDLLSQINVSQERIKELRGKIETNTAGSVKGEAYNRERLNRFQEVLQDIITCVEGMIRNKEDSATRSARESLQQKGINTSMQFAIDWLILERCAYYYDNSKDPCEVIPLKSVEFQQAGRKTPIFRTMNEQFNDLSGGTQSVMTVRSLASKPSWKPFGVVLLVDEWGDVQQIGNPLYEELRNMLNVLLAIFVRVEKQNEITPISLN